VPGIAFKNIPSNLRVPLFYVELDNSQANNATVDQRTLIIGQITAAGTGTPNIPQLSLGIGDAATVGGPGSMLHLMTNAYRLNDTFGEVWYLPLADDPEATAAMGSINVTAAPTANGTLSLYLAGVLVTLAVTAVQTAAQIATALAAAITATPNLPLTVAIDGDVATKIDITALNKGPGGNEIDIRFNYLGARNGEATPTGFTAAIVPMAGGATASSLATGLANLTNQTFDFIVSPYTDETSLNALQTFLNDTTGRWSWDMMLYGGVWAAMRGNQAALQAAIGAGVRNNQHETIMGFYDSPTPAWIWAAIYAGTAAPSLRNDPATPLQTLVMAGVLAPPLQSRFQIGPDNTLLYNGVSTFNVADDGTVSIQKAITTYQQNSFGQPDDSYLDVEDLYNLAFILRFMQTRITTKFARFKLADDGTKFAPGQNIVTPNIIRGDQIAAAYELQYEGYLQNADLFAQNLIVQRNANNRNRIDVLWPGDLIDRLNVFAMLAQFRK
jgi:phage tail sheath gpL-like